ncbi:MAG: TolC family protein [Cyclobacteriaceae bacterium]
MDRKRIVGFPTITGLRTSLLRLAAILLMLGTAASINAQSLTDYLKIAATNNPELKAQYNQYLAALEQVTQVGALPDPTFSLGYFISPVETRVGPQQVKLSLAQQLPWFGTLTAQEDAAAQKAVAQLIQVEVVKQQLFFQVKKQWYILYENQKIVELTEENIEILRSLESLALTRYEAGVAGLVDVIRAQLLISEMENELQLLEDNNKPLKARFNQLLNQDLASNIVTADTLAQVIRQPISFDQLVSTHPQVQYYNSLQEELNLQNKIAVLGGKPRFGVGLDYGLISERNISDLPDNGKNILMPMVSISLPLNQKKYRAQQREVDHKKASVQEQTQALLNQLSTDYEYAQRDYKDAERKTVLYKEQINQSNQALNILISSFSAAGQDFEEVLRMQQLILKYQTLWIKAQVAQHTAMAWLEYLSSEYNLNQEQDEN